MRVVEIFEPAEIKKVRKIRIKILTKEARIQRGGERISEMLWNRRGSNEMLIGRAAEDFSYKGFQGI